MIRPAIIVPRYGDDILGGAETIARQLAEHLPRAEFDVTVLTTCARDLSTWRNVFPPGRAAVNGVRVHRFPIDHRFRDEGRYRQLTHKFANSRPATVDEEYEWIDNNPHSPALYAYLRQHGLEFDLLLFVPYVSGSTLYGTTLWPERSVLWPCLHDEPFAHFLHTRWMMQTCRGLMFNTEPERALARDKLGVRNPGARVVGFGLEDFCGDGGRFRRQFGISEPFILYSGRLDSMKNVLELTSYFTAYKNRHPGPLKLVLRGEGPLAVPAHPDIVSIGFQSERDKLDAYAAATLLCQPSRLESFSIVIMESWLAGVPVLVHGDCEVTRHHVVRSNGGLYYSGFDEFAGALDWLLEHADRRERMGRLGRAYVLQEYNWPTVLARFRRAVASWLPGDNQGLELLGQPGV
jgi:glycosyltransferase involved in cell wall biosynthesis